MSKFQNNQVGVTEVEIRIRWAFNLRRNRESQLPYDSRPVRGVLSEEKSVFQKFVEGIASHEATGT